MISEEVRNLNLKEATIKLLAKIGTYVDRFDKVLYPCDYCKVAEFCEKYICKEQKYKKQNWYGSF